MSTVEIARGVIRVANSNMVNALKSVSVNKGYDLEIFLVVLGGGGPYARRTKTHKDTTFVTV
jgi:N-methylhydantoinase A